MAESNSEETKNLIIAVSIISICAMVYAPLITFFLIKFRRLSTLIVVQKRYPVSVSFLCIIIILYLIIAIPLFVISRTHLFFMKDNTYLQHIFKRITFIVYPVFNILIYYVLSLRCWHMVYDLHWSQAEQNSVWKYHLNQKLVNCNFWLKHKKTAGNMKWTRKIMFTVYFISVIISIGLFQLFLFQDNFIPIAHGIDAVFHLFPSLIIVSLWIKTPSISDNFFIRREFKYLSISVSIHLLIYITSVVIALSVDSYIAPILFILNTATSYFIIAMIMTWYIRYIIFCQIHLFNYVVSEKEKEKERKDSANSADSTPSGNASPSLPSTSVSRTFSSKSYNIDIGFLFGEYGASLLGSSSNSVRGRSRSSRSQIQSNATPSTVDGLNLPTFQSIELHSNSLHMHALNENNNNTESAKEFTKRVKLFHCITNKQTFELFIQHLASEFSQELLLCMLEIIQWKRAFYFVYEQVNNGKTIPTEQCHHQCPIGAIMPWSSIVINNFMKTDGKSFKQFKDNSELLIAAKKASHDLHMKYIEIGSVLEINIADNARRGLHSLCYDINMFIENDIDIVELFNIYDDVAAELYRLMNNSFMRFTKKPQWTKVIYILSKEPLFQPMMKK